MVGVLLLVILVVGSVAGPLWVLRDLANAEHGFPPDEPWITWDGQEPEFDD